MKSRIVKWFSVFVVLIMLAVAVPETASAEGSASGTFPDRTFSVIRSTPGSSRSDTLSIDILPAQTGNWWVTADTIAGSKVIVQVWRNDDGVLTLESSSKLSTVGEESRQTPLMTGHTYAATFTPFGKAGTSMLHEHFMVSGDIVWEHHWYAPTEQGAGPVVFENGLYTAGGREASPYVLDAVVRKYDSNGDVVWTRQFGSQGYDFAGGLAVDKSGLYVVGGTDGTLPGQTNEGLLDAFARKYDHNGNEVWTRQFGTPMGDAANDVAVSRSGIYVVGETRGAFPDQSNEGGLDAFVRKYDSDGNEIWTRQFGTSDSHYGREIAVDGTGVYVVGDTYDTLPGQASAGDKDAYIRKYDFDGNEVWTRQFGTPGADYAMAVDIDASGVYVAGCVNESRPWTTDAYVRKYDRNGSEIWTWQFGSSLLDRAYGVAVDASGVYVAGHTEGNLSGTTTKATYDAFVRKYDDSGNAVWTRQFSWSEWDTVGSIAVGLAGLYVTGFSWYDPPPQFYPRDSFVARLSP